jgi:hypothetical protein
LSQYRDTINNAVGKYIDTFRSDQNQLLIDAQSDFKAYTKAFNQLYEDMSATLLRQQEAVKALEYKRPRLMDESLENFMQFYNESMSPFLATHSKHVSDASTVSKKYLLRRKMIKKNERIVQSFYSRFVGSQLRDNWDSMRMSAQETVQNAEDSVRVALDDYHKLQEELALNAKQITIKSQEIIKNTLDKRLVRKETELLKSNLKNLENVGSQWLDEQMLKLDQALKVLQDRIQATSSLYEDLIVKRQASYYVTSQNDYTLNKILKLIDPAKQTQQGWKLLKEESGYKVWRKFMPPGMPGSQYACVMCSGIINASPTAVFSLFADNSRVPEYNSFYLRGKDLESIGDSTKVTWTATPPIFPFKPRDFVTAIHARKLKDGTIVVLNRAMQHAAAPVSSTYVRAQIILAANIIEPIKNDSKKCKLTMITQMDPGGFAPPVIINHICTLGPIGFLQNVEAAARKRNPGKKVTKDNIILKLK